MVAYDLKRARKATQLLVDSIFGKHHMRRVRSYAKKPRAVAFKEDETECLNELVKIGRQDPQALENLLALVEAKRDDRGDYQREYMAQKRARERKVIQLAEAMAGRALSLDERREVLLKQTQVWTKEKTKYVEAAAKSHRKATRQDPSWLEKTGYIKSFWNIKDTELDDLLREARKEKKPTKKVRR